MNKFEDEAKLKNEIFDLSDKMKYLSDEIDRIKEERDRKVKELMHLAHKG